MGITTFAWFVASIVAAERPEVPAQLDTTQPTCLAIGAPDADALYVVPRTLCDSRICKLRIELHAVRAEGPAPDPELLGEGELTAGASLWSPEVRAKVAAAASRFRLPCRSASADGPLRAGARTYSLKDRQGTWWAVSDNGREVPLSRLGASKGTPTLVDGHPEASDWAFARSNDHEGNLALMKIPLARLAAPSLAEIIATPRGPDEPVTCLGWDREAWAMLLKSTRRDCSAGPCRDEVRLVRVSARGSEDLGPIAHAQSALRDLDLGCTDATLDEPIFEGRALMIGPSLNDTSVEVLVFEPREQRWNLGPLRKVKTAEGTQRELISAILWHPGVPYLVLRLSALSGEGERYLWVDLATRRLAPKPR